MSVEVYEKFERLLEPLSEEELNILEQSLLKHGCIEPIIVYNGRIVDGHNRYRLCEKHNLPYQTKEMYFDNDLETMVWIANNQLGRRNLSIFARGELALKMKPVYAELAARRRSEPVQVERLPGALLPGEYGKTRDQLGEKYNVGSMTIDRVATILDKGTPEQIHAAKSGDKGIRPIYNEIIREQGREKREQEYKDNPLPEGVFDVILADPPWRYDYCPTESREIENHYPTMHLEDIKALRIPAAEDSILFLWATIPLMFYALEVIKAWGFTYKGQFVWDKVKIGMGFWNRIQHETLYIAIKGDFKAPNPENRQRSVIQSPYEEHSKKPDIVHDMIEQMYPGKKYLELFARRKHNENWMVWGNEV